MNPVTISPYRARADRLCQLVAERGLSAVVVYAAPVSAGFTSTTSGNNLFLANWQHPLLPSALVLTPDGDAVLFGVNNTGPPIGSVFGFNSYRTDEFAEREIWVDQRRASARPSDIGAALRKSVGKGRVGVIGGHEMPEPFHRELTASAGPVAFEDADQLLVIVKRHKDPLELELGRRAVECCAENLRAVMDAIACDQEAYRAAAAGQRAALSHGADWSDVWLGPTQVKAVARASWDCDRRFVDGDLIQIVAYATYMGRHAQLLRTGSKGRASPALQRAVAAAFEAQAHGVAELRPGAPISLAVDAIQDALTELTGSPFGKDPAQTRVGHLQGVQYTEPGDSDPFSIDGGDREPVVVRDGMRVVIHPTYTADGIGWVAVGDNFVVTAAGAEQVVELPRECVEL